MSRGPGRPKKIVDDKSSTQKAVKKEKKPKKVVVKTNKKTGEVWTEGHSTVAEIAAEYNIPVDTILDSLSFGDRYVRLEFDDLKRVLNSNTPTSYREVLKAAVSGCSFFANEYFFTQMLFTRMRKKLMFSMYLKEGEPDPFVRTEFTEYSGVLAGIEKKEQEKLEATEKIEREYLLKDLEAHVTPMIRRYFQKMVEEHDLTHQVELTARFMREAAKEKEKKEMEKAKNVKKNKDFYNVSRFDYDLKTQNIVEEEPVKPSGLLIPPKNRD